MELLEIRNNLVKLSYSEGDNPILGKFLTINSKNKSYVAQIVNLKSDDINSFIIARLMFTYTSDGIVDNYDGSVPELSSSAESLPSSELLALLPVESPVKFGNLAQEDAMLNVDISVFERNFTVFSEHDFEKETLISNCVRQLFRLKEKSVIFDTFNFLEDYPKLQLGKDFRLPLNSEMINFIFDYELSEVDNATKAVIEEIFYAVEQYIETLEDKFLPIDSFIDVVSAQYKENQMPELALLKNKLVKYKDAGFFANKKEDFDSLGQIIKSKNCTIIDLQNINGSLQNKVIGFVHKVLEGLEKYIYLFVPLNDENSDKKLLQKLINNNHVFTTLLVSHSYKYANELKEHAQNLLFFTPQSIHHDFAAYNTFLNKLNYGEGVLYGKLTQGIPFIIDVNDLELDLTKDDVFGDRDEFIPEQAPEQEVSKEPEITEESAEENTSAFEEIPGFANVIVPPLYEELPEPQINLDEQITDNVTEEIQSDLKEEENPVIELPQAPEVDSAEQFMEPVSEPEILPIEEEPVAEEIVEDDLTSNPNIIEPVENIMDDNVEILDEPEELGTTALTEDDLDFLDNNQHIEEIPEVEFDNNYADNDPDVPVVPIYPADEQVDDVDIDFVQGDIVTHPRYGRGVIEKIIKYGNKTLCSISFENVGRRLLDPSISEFEKA